MKKIIVNILLLLITNGLFAQIIGTLNRIDAEANFKKLPQQKIKVNSALVISDSATRLTSTCNDPGFESGVLDWADWHGYYGMYPAYPSHGFSGGFNCTNTSANNMDLQPWQMGLVQTGIPACEYHNWISGTGSYCTGYVTLTPNTDKQIHHQIQTAGNDPLLGALVSKVHSGNYSVRLGNDAVLAGQEKLEKRFVVTPTNLKFSFYYAVVMGNPCLSSESGCTSGHSTNGITTFIVQVKDVTNPLSPVLYNNLVDLGNGTNNVTNYDALLLKTLSYTDPCSSSAPAAGAELAYKPWSYLQINLPPSLIGKTVSIELITRDCLAGGHFSYAYLDDFCSQPAPNEVQGFAELATSDTCGLPGNICVHYSLPHTIDGSATGTVKLTLNFLQSGLPVSTPVVSPILTSGSNYCFSLPASLPGISASAGFDYFIKAEYTLSTVSLPNQIIGSVIDGVNNGQNNDYSVQCPTPCNCGDWGSIGYTLNGKADKFLCGNATVINVNSGDVFNLSPQYTCLTATGQPCDATIKYDIYFPKGGSLLNQTSLQGFKLDSCGNIRIVMTPTCGGKSCPPCDFVINVNCCACEQTLHPVLIWDTRVGAEFPCGGTYTDQLVCYKPYTIKVQNPCGDNCQPDSIITKITYPSTAVVTSYSLAGTTLIANQVGNYFISIKVKCNGKWCKECILKFVQTKKCEPPCDNCKVNGQDKVKAGFDPSNPPTSYTVGTFPAPTTLNAGFFLGGGTDTYTQIRANIVDVQLTSGNPACLQCYNTPNQWGSITAGNLNGLNGVPTAGSAHQTNANNNPREIVFNPTSPVIIPNMTPLTLNLQLPGVNPLSCCCIHVIVFVKITFRNNKCEECSKVIKIEFDECGPNGNGPGEGTLQFGGHPQFRQHAPSNEDVKLMTDIKTNIKSN